MKTRLPFLVVGMGRAEDHDVTQQLVSQAKWNVKPGKIHASLLKLNNKKQIINSSDQERVDRNKELCFPNLVSPFEASVATLN